MEAYIRDIIKKYGLERSASIIAVSGGVDSVVLLDLMAKNLPAGNIIVAHLNHGLRKESNAEADFVENLAKNYKLEYQYKRLKLTSKDEATAREKRYRWLKELATKKNAKYIITAHHLDDQAETIILNLIRGAGPLDIWGMKECDTEILRPLLSFSKNDIQIYARKNRLKYCNDLSNQNVRYSRNRVRHNIIPEMGKINPSFSQTLQNELNLGQELKQFMDHYLDMVQKRLVKNNRIELKGLKRLHPYLAKELIKRQLHSFTGKKSDIYLKNILAVYDLIGRSGLKETRLGNLKVQKTYQYLIFGEPERKSEKSQSLGMGQSIKFNDFVIRTREGSAKPNNNNILLPLEFSGNLKVRTWRSGDKIEAKFGTKKIQDVFGDAKIEVAERHRWPIITHKNKIVWVPRLIAGKDAKKSNINLIIEVK